MSLLLLDYAVLPLLTAISASSLGMLSEDEKKVQRLEDIRELLS